MRVVPPGKVKNHREVIAKIDEWQVRVDALSRDRWEELSGKMRIVALAQMLPGDVRAVVCQSLGTQST